MSKLKWTPGPWHPGCFVRGEDACPCRYIFGDGYQGSIAEISLDNGRYVGDGGNDSPRRDEAIANARLIAAAPDLAEAAEPFVRYEDYAEDRSNDDAMDIPIRDIRALAAAYRKARGETA